MTLTQDQIELIRSSAQTMAESDVSVTNIFYASLFRKAPSVRALFPEDMFRQSEKLWSSIVAVVNGIDDIAALIPTLENMGARHVGYGAQPAHYDAVRDTLIETMADFLAEDWTTAHERAWGDALDIVVKTMLNGADVAA